MAEAPARPGAASRGLPLAAASLLFSATLVASICLAFELRWETNDDPGMAMAAHGFGLAAHGSPNLIYSNVLWGHLVRALPPVGGVLGYSLAALVAMSCACWALLYGLLRLGAGWPSAALAMLLAVAPAVLSPQFTITAGLLAVASVVAVTVHDRHGGRHHLAMAALLGFAGFLVRYEEFLLVMAVASPLLPWRGLFRNRALQLTVAGTGLAMVAATAFDRQAYAGEEWAPFLALETPRAQFTDFNVGDRLLAERPDIPTRHGYSRNDIELIGNYFFADPALANPSVLQAMLDELGPPRLQAGGLRTGLDALWATAHPRLLPLLACALALWLLCPGWRLAAAWLVFLALVFTVGYSGRPGVDILRIYVPPLCLLALLPLASQAGEPGRWRRHAALAVVFGATAWQLWNVLPPALAAHSLSARVQRDLAQAPPGSVIAWGGAFPYRNAFPVLSRNQDLRRIRIYSLGTDTLAPYAVAVADERQGQGLIDRLTGPEGIALMPLDRHLPLLRRYCREHFGGRLQVLGQLPLASVRIVRVRCLPGKTPVPPPRQGPALATTQP